MAFDIDKIESKIDKVVTGGIELNDEGSGIAIKRLVDAMEVAKLISISGPAIPSFMRGNPGICYAAVVRAVRWRFDPYFVAEQMYLTNNKGEEKIAFMAQLINAVINAHAPIQGKLRCRYEGEADDRVCIVYGTPKGEKDPLEYRTPTLKTLIDARGRNDYGKIKGSPLYETDPDQQLWYYGSRSFCRKYFPEVLGGVYAVDEFEPVEPKDVTPERGTLTERMKKQKRIASPRGFDAAHVERETQGGGDHQTAVADDSAATSAGSEAAPSATPAVAADGAVPEPQA